MNDYKQMIRKEVCNHGTMERDTFGAQCRRGGWKGLNNRSGGDQPTNARSAESESKVY